jgi:hypothetical protein|nr:MAG TPA: hypothetical protein [Caudoviricetes sp.]
MAIKFSELRGLLKDTNIQTVKMSDPVYSIQMEKITYKNYYIFSEQRKSISFNNLHYLKNNNQLYLLNQILPFNIRIDFTLEEQVFRNTKILIKKNSIFKFYQLAIQDINELYYSKQIPNTLYSCFYLNNTDNNNILNPCLTKIVLSDYVNNIKFFPDIKAQKYYGSRWNILDSVKKIKPSKSEKHMFYDYEIIDRDTNLNSSVLLYTSPITNFKFTTISVYFGYKPNDNIKQRYKALQMSVYNSLSTKRDEVYEQNFIFNESFCNEKSESPTLTISDGGIYFLEDLRW